MLILSEWASTTSKLRLIAGCALLLSIACAPTTLAPLTVPFQYKTMADPTEFPLLQTCSAVSVVEAVDSRTDANLGTRYLERRPATTSSVTSSGDVAAWARSGVEEALRRARVAVRGKPAPILRIVVEHISTEERVYRRAEYSGRVVLLVELRRSDNEQSCWQERVDGGADNYGYAGSRENYQETVDHAFDRAVIRALNSGGFKEAVCACAPKGIA
jgi:hypothetical protein